MIQSRSDGNSMLTLQTPPTFTVFGQPTKGLELLFQQLPLVLQANGYRAIHGARLIAADGDTWHMRFADYDLRLPDFGLVVPRLELDELLRQHAVEQGARFLATADITRPLHGPAVIGVCGRRPDGPLTVQARLTVLATGAAIGLLRSFGILRTMPIGINAVRGYFAGVADLADTFDFYFEHDLAPGYAWIFPVSADRANVGLGMLRGARSGPPPDLRARLADFMQRQPRLRHATPLGPLKSYPIRIDFPACPVVGDGFLVVGEAAGLVNPVTGEGIDLALESAEIAADAIHVALALGDTTAHGLRSYARTLHRRYAGFFRGVRVLLRLATGPTALGILIRRAQRRPWLAHTIAGINLGVASPWLAFSPRTWWELLRG